MNLYFGDLVTIVTTIMLLVAFVYVVYTTVKEKDIKYWGRKTLTLGLWGLILCCFAAARDGYDKSVQASFDTSVLGGLFSTTSLQSTLCCIGGGIIAISTITSIFVKNQRYRKAMFFILGATIVLKALIIEISRWVM